MDRISDPQPSPDGKWVAFTVRATDLEANKGRTDLWLVGTDGSALRRLTTHEANDGSPRWMPDGKSLAFLSTRSGSSQVWRLPIDGGEAMQLTKLPVDLDNLRVFPDGKRLLFTAEVYPELKSPALEETAKRDQEKEKSKVKARTYESLLFRHWDSWEDGKRSHLFAWTIGGAAPIDLTAGFDGDVPPKPFGGVEDISISPDGREVAFTARRLTRDAAWTTNLDVYSAPSDASAPPKLLTGSNPATDEAPLHSPDGKTLAYFAMERPGYEADRRQIVLLDRASGSRRVLADSWDRSPSELAFAPDGSKLYATADDLGNHSLFSIDLWSGAVTRLLDRGNVTRPAPLAAGIVYSLDTLAAPAELFVVGPDGKNPRPLTRLNAEKVAAAQTGEYEQFSFPGAKGETVYGYLVRPVGFKPGRKYPVAVIVHGGPQGSMKDQFHYRWNPQVYAGAGYAVVFVDFHGSTGYGQAFSDAIRRDWGGAPFEDVMKGLDFALAKYPFLDGRRACALGASYGGFMVFWSAGQTDRFRCLVSHDGSFNAGGFHYETEELWFPEWEFGGTPWDNPLGYSKHDPSAHVKKWKTPLLVIHGGNDFRLVETQGLSAFTAAQRLGVPSKLLHFPDENHWVLKPQNSVLWHQTVLGWLEKWTRG
ncbi:MAG: S9 family peptidase [Myxococcales bacterium]|nr:S9 family peptidase [Myxococcales bacterium]